MREQYTINTEEVQNNYQKQYDLLTLSFLYNNKKNTIQCLLQSSLSQGSLSQGSLSSVYNNNKKYKHN